MNLSVRRGRHFGLEPELCEHSGHHVQHLGHKNKFNCSPKRRKRRGRGLPSEGTAKEITCDPRPYHRCFRSLLETETETQNPEARENQKTARSGWTKRITTDERCIQIQNHKQLPPPQDQRAQASENCRTGENSNLFPFHSMGCKMCHAMPSPSHPHSICDSNSPKAAVSWHFFRDFRRCVCSFRFQRIHNDFIDLSFKSFSFQHVCSARRLNANGNETMVMCHRLCLRAKGAMHIHMYAGHGNTDTDTNADSLSTPFPCSLEQLRWPSYQ
nr:uncharacterized protein LOC123003069 [Drosophila takahashii]